MNSGERFAAVRAYLGLTQADMALKVGVVRDRWRKYENDALPNGNTLERLAELGFSIDWLLTGRGEMRPTTSNANEPIQGERVQTDRELMARIMDGLVVLYREENQRLVPLDQGRMAAEIYDSLIGIEDEAERRGGLRALLEQRRLEMRRPAPDTTSGKRSA